MRETFYVNGWKKAVKIEWVVRITFRKLQVKGNLFFRQFNTFFFFQNQSAEKACLRIVILNCREKLTKDFLNKIKIQWTNRTKITLRKKKIEIKKSLTRFGVLHVKLANWPPA